MSKLTISTEVWVAMRSVLAEWHVEESAIDNLWKKDDEGNLSYTDEAQNKFNSASDSVEEILESFFEKGSWSERENI
tara:strand:- start:466 stop:696 length:231 start_codon:yes stop_codon:yes gene_type:complete